MKYFSAAHLCAAGIATILSRMQKPYVTVGIDGSVYRFHPTFARILDQKIDKLLEPNLESYEENRQTILKRIVEHIIR
uniref:Phosphotransferase n=1 Tax=Parascaris equorum TaxID=6256 RepID=A0A914RX01_PAREQ